MGLWRRALPLHAAVGMLLYPRLWEAFLGLDDLGGFEVLLQERLVAEPDDGPASLWLARVVVRQGRVDEGLAILRRVLDRDSRFLSAYTEMGRILLREERAGEALKTFEELLGKLPTERGLLSCRSCGTQDSELHWSCPQCGEWDSFV